MERCSAQPLAPVDVEEWTRKIARVWTPRCLREIRGRTGGGFLFILELYSGLALHLGVQPGGVDLCALWCGEECVVWDQRLGFCWVFGAVPLGADKSAAFGQTALGLLIRRNCFLMGASVEATPEEVEEWKLWMEEQEGHEPHILSLTEDCPPQECQVF